MLVSAFLAAAALAQTVGGAMGYERTAVLFVEPDTATLAVVETSDGSIVDVYRQQIYAESYDEAVAQLSGMVADAGDAGTRSRGPLLVGSGVDVAPIKPVLEAATSLRVSAPEEPETALARGAALASANAPLFASSTAALAYAQDPGTGEVLDPYALDSGLFNIPENIPEMPVAAGEGGLELAYSALPSPSGAYTVAAGDYVPYVDADEDEFTTGMFPDFVAEPLEGAPRRPFLTAMSVMTIFVVGVVALVLSLAVGHSPARRPAPDPGPQPVAPAHALPRRRGARAAGSRSGACPGSGGRSAGAARSCSCARACATTGVRACATTGVRPPAAGAGAPAHSPDSCAAGTTAVGALGRRPPRRLRRSARWLRRWSRRLRPRLRRWSRRIRPRSPVSRTPEPTGDAAELRRAAERCFRGRRIRRWTHPGPVVGDASKVELRDWRAACRRTANRNERGS